MPTVVEPTVHDPETQAVEIPTLAPETLSITILYENGVFDQRLKPAWGFSALVEYQDHTLLFDTGGEGSTLLANMRTLGIDPAQIESVVLSHAHGDHTGGLSTLLQNGAHPNVYLLSSFSEAFLNQVNSLTVITAVTPGFRISENIYSTGEVGGSIPEQALIVRTEPGLVIVTGCAHPGIARIVQQARSMFDEPVRLVLGGFHLGDKSRAEIETIVMDFRRMEVQQVAPCHCTGELAITLFKEEYGENFLPVGVGSIIRMDSPAR